MALFPRRRKHTIHEAVAAATQEQLDHERGHPTHYDERQRKHAIAQRAQRLLGLGDEEISLDTLKGLIAQ